MLYPIWSKLIPYLCMHQRGYEHQAFVAKIQLSKMRSECRIQQLNLVDQWDEWELAPGNSSKVIFVVLLFGDLGYEEVSHKDVPGRSVLSVFAVSEKTTLVERVAVVPFILLASEIMAFALI